MEMLAGKFDPSDQTANPAPHSATQRCQLANLIRLIKQQTLHHALLHGDVSGKFDVKVSGLLAILAKSIAIAIAILGGNSIAILSAILYFKSVLQYYCNNFFNTPSRACAHIQHGTGSHCQLYYYKWKPRCTHIIVPALTQH